MSIERVVSNVGVFRTWVNTLTMSLRSPFKPQPFVQFIGMPCSDYKLFFGLTISIVVTSYPCLEMTTVHLYVYILALFIIVSQVKDCHWAPRRGERAARLSLRRCLHVVLRLTMGYEEKVEYVPTIVVAKSLWSQCYARLPGVAHREEPCEALLSRAVHLMG